MQKQTKKLYHFKIKQLLKKKKKAFQFNFNFSGREQKNQLICDDEL